MSTYVEATHGLRPVSPSSMINYRGCTQLGEDLFARKLGETEDFEAALRAANFTRDQGERALRNRHVCAIAEEAHAKACQILIDQLSSTVPLASIVAEQSSKALKQHFATRSEAYRAYGVSYDDTKRLKRIKQMINGLELRKHRAAFAFQDTRWELPEA